MFFQENTQKNDDTLKTENESKKRRAPAWQDKNMDKFKVNIQDAGVSRLRKLKKKE